MRRLPLRLRLGLVGVLGGVVFAGTVGWGQAEFARTALGAGPATAGAGRLIDTGNTITGAKGSTTSTGTASPKGNKMPTDSDSSGKTKPAADNRLRVQVESGDTLFGIAQGYGVDLDDLRTVNQGVAPESLQPGQELALPAMAVPHLTPDLQRFQGLFGWPLEAPLTSPFGPRWGRFHAGIDFAADTGTAIRASRDGRVTTAAPLKDYGLTVILTHADGTRTLYGHCSALRVQEGEQVKAGDVIAEVGSTGLSTGPHLHFEIRVSDEPHDPLLFLSR